MRALWKGAVVVGQVSIPVTTHKAADQADDVQLKTLHEICGTPISQTRGCSTCKFPLASDQSLTAEQSATVQAFEFAPGQFVKVTPAELEQAAGGKKLVLDRFLAREVIKPVLVDTTMFLAPSSDPLAVRAYAALLRSMEKTGRVGIGRFGYYSRERIGVVWPIDVEDIGVILGLSTLFPAHGVRSEDAGTIARTTTELGAAEPTKKEVDLFAQLLEQLTVPASFKWRTTTRVYPSMLRKLLEQKRTGGEIVIAPAAESVAPPDLTDALTRSVQAVKRRSAKKTPARAAR